MSGGCTKSVARYAAISAEHGVLSKGERQEWLAPLDRSADPAMRAGIAGTFMQVLKRSDVE
ncbi:hypothetical protein [Burkholderia sp. JP2-270]|uniref:hypothetical protein n=1 Tax=Burkholderia sp. JP2-270 TaxID=2217913 RepID=UPI0013A6E7E3|nr:hypothetical protein [Burkholderia sp. JP2-270]